MKFSRIKAGQYACTDASGGTFAVIDRVGPPVFYEEPLHAVTFGHQAFLVPGTLKDASDFVRAEFAHQQASA